MDGGEERSARASNLDGRYCTNSVNSAGHVTRYTAAEIFISAPRQNDRYIHFFSADDHFSQDYYCKLPAEAAYLKKQL